MKVIRRNLNTMRIRVKLKTKQTFDATATMFEWCGETEGRENKEERKGGKGE